ncbi:senescence-induced receptor-like serine/threonine-protein kinase [Vigna umbellata]|uniref:senescence-induced receptor-like serine/threonine-protein kinase n=1 Tax=Vigna umbellata TaxID=87088 RepID=UPI001F5FB23F|nr:senescence-induced receptor-like serine/threonine-protein kinase [Vigna umbellata]
MDRELQWILVLAICASSLINILAENSQLTYWNLANLDYSGVISIDCGVDEGYTDKTTNLQYEADDIQFGEINNTSSIYNMGHISQIHKQLNTLRSFPYGKRNCYTLTPKQGKNKKYIIRAYFAYGNYDNENKPPVFDLHLGVNFLKTINSSGDVVIRIEAVHFASTERIDLCLVNIDQGVPFISLLELWPLDNSIYQSSSTLLTLDLLTRLNLGASEDNFIRYTDDIYGRSWEVPNNYNKRPLKTSSAIDLDKFDDPYKLPAEVLSSAVEARDSNSLEFTLNYGTLSEYYVYLHFFDFEDRTNKQKRRLNIVINGFEDNNVTEFHTLSYWKPYTIILPIKQGMGIRKILIEANSDSDELPAMLNALEIYRVLPQSDSSTQEQDVYAIRHIKHVYMINNINWQGDPCGPKNFTWEGVKCSNGDTPRIISLNLSSSKLSGEIDASFSNLTCLVTLDLSDNELSGEVPEFFAKLPQLHFLNLSRNRLTGSVPESLKAKSSNNSLQLSFDGNLRPYRTGSCKSNHKKFIIPLVASITACVAVVLTISTIVMVIWRLRKKGKVISSISVKDEPLKSANQVFSYSDIRRITNNFTTMIGKGGFGKVYLGTLECGERVAVKILSSPSAQGYKEFQSEAKLLMHVHHRNVVSLVGYCDESDTKALIYEYLSEGNLQQKLSDKNPIFLEWTQRLKIAMDAANGLDYLHNGCKPPVIHRDLKTSNILLDENMHAKISDFGVSKTFANDNDTYVTTYPAGTPGYLDPEFYCSGTLNKKSDVYSFGIILLELITGQPALTGTSENLSYILPWVNNKLRTGNIQEIVDRRLHGKYNGASAWKFVGIAMSCLPQVPIHRPDIGHIALELKDCLSLELSLERTVSNVRESLAMSSRQIEFH